MQGRLTVEGLRESQARIDAVGERARRPEPALRSRSALQALHRSEQRAFAGNRFSKDTPAWVRAKRRTGLSPKRMQASGRLRLLLEASTPSGSGPIRFSAYDGALTWGLKGGRTSVYYARIWANKDKGRRVVKVDRKARVDLRDVVSGYVFVGTLA